jgi:hypothetical protein
MNLEIESTESTKSTKSKILDFLKSSKKNQFKSKKQYTSQYESENENEIGTSMYDGSYISYDSHHRVNSEKNSCESELASLSYFIKSNGSQTEHVIENKTPCLCLYCNDNNNNNQLVILSCNHTFHIKCLATTMNLNALLIDDEFLNSIYCAECNTKLDSSEILFIHNKFYNQTNEYLISCNDKIKNLEKDLNKIKDELKVNLEYKQKLERSKEQSKLIILTLNNNL